VPEETTMSDPIRIRARKRNDVTEVTVLMPHPMETGLRVAASGSPVPAHFITNVDVWAGERKVFGARFGIAVSRDPLLTFRFRGGAVGDPIRVIWRDNRGEQRTGEAVTA
jgi:sulfur-oxidizing protein SoxZ